MIASPHMQNTEISSKPISVIVVGQTPPPFHGQSLMIQMLLDGPMEGVEMHHIRMAFSDNMDQVGRFQLAKVLHLFALIVRIFIARIRTGATILYYPPAGPNRVPIFRDIVLLISTRWMFRKTVFHFHANGMGELIPKFPAPLRALAWWALGRPHASIQLSELTRQDGKWFQAQHIYVVPNAVHDETLRLKWSPADRVPVAVQRILYVGTVCEGKGILVLLDACRQLKLAQVPFHLDVVGSFQPTTFGDDVRRAIADSQLQDHVTLHGQKTGDDKWKMFTLANIFCFPSHYESEGVPCVLIEAMCFALPVVSTRWRGIPSLVESGVTGYLVEPHDSMNLCNAIRDLIVDPIAIQSMGQAGRSRFLNEFSNQQYLQKMRQVFADTAKS
jgi:glycosyltransferase involved in cell wall biosynthesis